VGQRLTPYLALFAELESLVDEVDSLGDVTPRLQGSKESPHVGVVLVQAVKVTLVVSSLLDVLCKNTRMDIQTKGLISVRGRP